MAASVCARALANAGEIPTVAGAFAFDGTAEKAAEALCEAKDRMVPTC